MPLFIKYSNKYPYLPEAVADSKKELAEILGTTRNTVEASYSHKRSTYAIVDDEDIKAK